LDNSDERIENAAILNKPYIVGQNRFSGKLHEIKIVGTAHVSEKSISEVSKAIEEVRPDIVAVELCPGRYRTLTGHEEDHELKISELLSGSKLYILLVQLFLAYIQKRIGDELGVKPGSEMLAAIETAQKVGARFSLVDRDVGITIQRFWAAMGFVEKIKLIFALSPVALGLDDEDMDIDIDKITHDDIVSQMISEFRKVSPSAANVLVDERDAYIAKNLYELSKEGRVLAVVGVGHKEGIERLLAHPKDIPEIEELKEEPTRRFTFVKIFGVAVTILIVATLGLVLVNVQSGEGLLLAFGIWFLVTGGLSALGVVLVRGHPLSAITALMVAWLTTLIPFIAAGWFAGMVEAWKLKPTVSDLKKLGQARSFKEMMENRLFKVIMVTAMANLGAMAGMFLGVYLIWQKLGWVNPTGLLKGIL
jgi:pheromone shutdown-related protein TraB